MTALYKYLTGLNTPIMNTFFTKQTQSIIYVISVRFKLVLNPVTVIGLK